MAVHRLQLLEVEVIIFNNENNPNVVVIYVIARVVETTIFSTKSVEWQTNFAICRPVDHTKLSLDIEMEAMKISLLKDKKKKKNTATNSD